MDLAKADQSVREIPRSQLSDSGVPVFCDGITAMQYAFFLFRVCVCECARTSLGSHRPAKVASAISWFSCTRVSAQRAASPGG